MTRKAYCSIDFTFYPVETGCADCAARKTERARESAPQADTEKPERTDDEWIELTIPDVYGWMF
jgi:hypothetical protein